MLLHIGVADGHWLFMRHCTQAGCPIGRPAMARRRQYGVAAGQSVLTSHATQTCAAEQTGVDVPAQLALLVHWTQMEVATSQCGAVAAVHCASEVQPARQRNVAGSQTGAGVPQSELERHATQAPREVRHRG